MSTQSGARVFPGWFVPDCPPPDADEASGTIYRFVAENPTNPEEFRSYHETGERPNAPACQRCGLSVFRKVEDIRGLLLHLWKTYPRRSYGPHVVKRDLTPADGVTKATGRPGHQTWWAYEGVERHASFEFVETIRKS
jgi:hypothetical protein